jgi:heme exporter protein C
MPHWSQVYSDATVLALWLPPLTLALCLGLLAAALWLDSPGARRLAWILLGVQGLCMFAALPYLGLVWAPPEKYMGDTGRILYVHVPQVWMALLGTTINFGCSLAYLFRKSWVTDSLAEASAETALLFGTVGVALGAIWAKPTWGVYWTWDPRLTTAAILLVVYAGYLALRRFVEDPEKRATWSAVLGIVAYVDIPVLWYSVKWWKSMHQVQSPSSALDPTMTMVLRFGTVAFLCAFAVFTYLRFLEAQAARRREVALPESLPGRMEVPA